MVPIPLLGELIGCDDLLSYTDPETWHSQRDEIKGTLARHLATEKTSTWLFMLEPSGHRASRDR